MFIISPPLAHSPPSLYLLTSFFLFQEQFSATDNWFPFLWLTTRSPRLATCFGNLWIVTHATLVNPKTHPKWRQCSPSPSPHLLTLFQAPSTCSFSSLPQLAHSLSHRFVITAPSPWQARVSTMHVLRLSSCDKHSTYWYSKHSGMFTRDSHNNALTNPHNQTT